MRLSRVRVPLLPHFGHVAPCTVGRWGAFAKSILADLWAWLGRCRARAAERRALARLTDTDLRDIGISRADVEMEIDKWPWRP